MDEREGGVRALLNLGHTFGHAIETKMGYGEILHGEAVAIGMCLAAQFSAQLGWLQTTEVVRIKNLLKKMALPIQLPTGLAVEQLLEGMKVDKKVRDGKVRLVLLLRLGQAIITYQYDPNLLRQYLSEMLISFD